MRKAFLLIGLILLVSTTLFSAEKRTFNVTSAGTLPNLISESEKYNIEKLTLTGELNGTDFRLLRDMAGCNYLGEKTKGRLKVLDFSGAKIVTGGEKYLDTNDINGSVLGSGSYHYDVSSNNVVPQYVFFGCFLENVNISKTATSIGDNAFSHNGLTSVEIPNSVTSIEDGAFSGCSSLTTISIPKSVTNIGKGAFRYSGLFSAIIPVGITTIGNFAFDSCKNLENVTISKTVKSIGYAVFHRCSSSLVINVDSESPYYSSEEGVLFDKDKTELVCYPSNKKGNEYIIPASVKRIGTYAFMYASLMSITIPYGVTSIEWGAFDSCDNLSTVIIPKSVIYIGDAAFRYCENLKSLIIPGGVKSIGDYAARNCKNLTQIVIPYSVTSIGKLAFDGCIKLEDIVSEITNPFEISENTFSTYSTATLTVPSCTKSKYQSTKYWNKFTNIVEKGPEQANDKEFIEKLAKIKQECVLAEKKMEEYKAKYYDIKDFEIGSPWKVRSYYDDGIKDIQGLKMIISSCEDKIAKGELVTQQERDELDEKYAVVRDYYSESITTSLMGYICTLTVTCNGGGQVRTWIDRDGQDDYGKTTLRNETKTLYWLYPKFGELYRNARTNGFLEIIIEPDEGYIAEVNGKEVSKDTHLNGEGRYDVIFVKSPTNVITLTANSYIREYGDTNPDFSYTVTGGSISGTPKITCSATKTSPVGTYEIKIEKGSVTTDNVTYNNGTLTITKAPLTITAKSYTRQQGEANPTFEVTYSGFKNGESEAVLTQKPKCSTTATANSSPGKYDITVSGAEAQNYNISYVKGTLTITAASQQSFTQQGITYLGNPSTLKAEVQSVDNDVMSVEIPSSVTYNGRTYEVNSIADYTFNYKKKNYVSIPSTITSISSTTFYRCMMGALVWNANYSLPQSVFNNMEQNANFLLYVNSRSYAPSNVSNVVVGNSASSITLSDGSSVRFYCPKEFTAQNITYTHHYGMITGGNGKGWETIALPFEVKQIKHATKGELTPFASYQSGTSQRPFWLYKLGSNGFQKAAVIEANTPYIISMPNNSAYDEEYILAGDVTFSSTNAKVVKTESLVTAESKGKRFIPAFSIVESSPSIYALNVHNYLTSYSGADDPGSKFISDLRYIKAFEAYMTTTSSARTRQSIDIEFDEDETTGIDDVIMKHSANSIMEIFNLGGQRVAIIRHDEFENFWLALPSGVYIINGKKTIK